MNNNYKFKSNEVEDIISLVPMQEGMLFHYLKYPLSSQYFEQTCYILTGKVRVNILKMAWQYVIESNEMLRVVYRWNGLNRGVQVVLKKYDLPLVEYDVSNENQDEKQKIICNIEKKERENRVDILSQIIRVALCKLSENEYEMIVNTHHIIFDGWSNIIILKELIYAYNCFSMNIEPIRKRKNKYKELVKWYQKQDKQKQRLFWSDNLDGFIHRQVYPVVHTIPDDIRESEIEEKPAFLMPIDENLVDKMDKYTKEKGITYAVLFYSAWSILLYKYSGLKDLVFGTTVSGRSAKIKGIDDMVGLFINTIPLRIKINNNMPIQELLEHTKLMVLQREGYEFTSLADIKQFGEIHNSGNIFDTAVVIENYPVNNFFQEMDAQNRLVIDFHSSYYSTNLNLVLGVRMFGRMQLDLVYNTDLYNSKSVKKLADQYLYILDQLVAVSYTDNLTVEEINILNKDEKEKMISSINKSLDTLNSIEKVDFDEIF